METSTIEDIILVYRDSLEQGDLRTRIQGLNLQNQSIVGERFSFTDWVECDFSGVQFVDCDLRGSDFTSSKLENVVFERCAIFGCEFSNDHTIIFRKCICELIPK